MTRPHVTAAQTHAAGRVLTDRIEFTRADPDAVTLDPETFAQTETVTVIWAGPCSLAAAHPRRSIDAGDDRTARAEHVCRVPADAAALLAPGDVGTITVSTEIPAGTKFGVIGVVHATSRVFARVTVLAIATDPHR